VAIIAGMHGGEYAGVLAATQLIRHLARAEVRGRVLVIPIQSALAFFSRSMQLSPVDGQEVHYLWPGNPGGSFSEHLVDLVFRTLRVADAVIDLHAGEFVQDLTPYVGVPWLDDGPLWQRSLDLATGFDVPFINRRAVAETNIALPRALLEVGIPNVWTEIGRNGLPEPTAIALQYEGLVNVLALLDVLPGSGTRYSPRQVGPRHWSILAEQSGLWHPKIRAGQRVAAGQLLGEMTDVFGDQLQTYTAPADALATFVCTSPAIDIDNQPHGNNWHRHVVQLVDDPHAPRSAAGGGARSGLI
jgi:predicted deacylase